MVSSKATGAVLPKWLRPFTNAQLQVQVMAIKIYTKTGDKGSTALIGGTKVPKSHLRIESYGTVDELNSFIGLLGDHLAALAPADGITSIGAPAGTAPSHPNTAVPPTVSVPCSLPAGSSPDFHAPEVGTHPVVGAPAGMTDGVLIWTETGGTVPMPLASGGAKDGPSAAAPVSRPVSQLDLLREVQDRLFTIGSSLACDPEKEPKLKIPDLKEEDIERLEKEIDRMEGELPPLKAFLLPGGHVAVSTAHVARCVCRRAERSCVRLAEEGLFVEPAVIRYLNRLSDYLFVLARYIAHGLNVPEIPWKPRT